MESNMYEDIGRLYHTTVVDMFLPMDKETAIDVYSAVMEVVDDIQLNTNWFIPSVNVIRTSLYASIRSDLKVFTLLVKLERLMAFKLTLMDTEDHFHRSLARMFHLDGVEEDIVDEELGKLFNTPSTQSHKQLTQIQRVPGIVGLLTAIQYRHIWASIKPQ